MTIDILRDKTIRGGQRIRATISQAQTLYQVEFNVQLH